MYSRHVVEWRILISPVSHPTFGSAQVWVLAMAQAEEANCIPGFDPLRSQLSCLEFWAQPPSRFEASA